MFAVFTGTQFTGTLAPGQTKRWFTFNWPADRHIVWYVVPTTPKNGAPELDWDTEVERASSTHCTYWITVKNLTSVTVTFEGRYAVLN
ncbi:hypothetical protein GCM10009819_29350 [Agromyces tropicus]|uniref:Uncharacterized protein n=1 Tax=Agromyces tropicus TaxID=555371 RepID=A0ABP5G8H3_9MICO